MRRAVEKFLPAPPPGPVYSRGIERWPESTAGHRVTDSPAPSFHSPRLALRRATPSWFTFRPFRFRPLDAFEIRARLAQRDAQRDKEHGHG